jgi:hypothetical protein
MGQGEVIMLPVAAGAEGAGTADSDATRYSGRYSPHNAEESHAKNLAHSRRPGESTSDESGAERAGPPAACRGAKRCGQDAGFTGGASTTSAVAATREATAEERTPGGAREA